MKHRFIASVVITALIFCGCSNYLHELIPSNENKILSFTVPGQTMPSVITEDSISVTVDKDTSLDSLIPEITISQKASLIPLTDEYIQAAFPSISTRVAEMYTTDTFADDLFDLIREDKDFNVPKVTIPVDFSIPVDFLVISGKGKIRRYTVYVTKDLIPVTITGLSVEDKVYDGTTEATITGTATISGLISGDDVTVIEGTIKFEDKNTGTDKPVKLVDWSLEGADADNYILQPLSVTANITAKPVTITGLSAANKVYDGITTATSSGGTINGLIGGDTVSINYGITAFESAAVGNNKTVTFSGFSLGGADADNYTLSAQPANVTATIRLFDQVWIQSGTFTMGSPADESGRDSDETQHSVTLTSSFYMGKYQVTQTQYQTVMGSNPSYFTGSPAAGETQGNRPVERVSWYDALVFCNKLSMLEDLGPAYRISGSTDPANWGTVPTSSNTAWDAVTIVAGSFGYRLPTEAQWEYVCRAGTTTAYNLGGTWNDNWGWISANSNIMTHEVGKKTPNAYGLYDMHGNVYEWCWDWYNSGYYSSSPTNDPQGAASGSNRVMRGGYYNYAASYARSAYRSNNNPSNRSARNGFRLVRP